MLPISFARHSSSMPMLSNAFQLLRVGAAVQLRRLSYQCPCFSMHLLFCAALFCAFARPLAANPTQCRAYPSNAKAFLRSAIANRCRSSPSQSTVLPLLSASVPQLIASLRICSAAARSYSKPLRVCSMHIDEIPRPFAPLPFCCCSLLSSAHQSHIYAGRIVSVAELRSALLLHCRAILCNAAAVMRHSAAYAL